LPDVALPAAVNGKAAALARAARQGIEKFNSKIENGPQRKAKNPRRRSHAIKTQKQATELTE